MSALTKIAQARRRRRAGRERRLGTPARPKILATGRRSNEPSQVPTVHIRPTYFAEWLLYLAPMIRAGRLHVPFGTGKHAPIAAEDQGRVIAGLLADPAAHRGKAYPLFGPVEYTYEETARVLSRVLGKDIEYKQG